MLKRVSAAGVMAFSVLSGVEGAVEPANAAQMATEVVQVAAVGDEVDPVEDPDAKAEAPERVKVSTPSSFDNFWATKAQTKTPAEAKKADAAAEEENQQVKREASDEGEADRPANKVKRDS